MRVRLKGLNSVTKRLADGRTVSYYYAWKGGPPLTGEYGSHEFIDSYMEACATKIAPPTGVLQALLFRFQESADFQHGIEERTRRDYIKQIKRIEQAFGDFPIKGINDPRATSIFLEWRDKLAQTSLRQADYAYGTLSRVLSWALKRRRRQALSRQPRQQNLARRRGLTISPYRSALSSAGNAARHQYRTTAR